MATCDQTKLEQLRQHLLPGVSVKLVYDAYVHSAGKELDGKFFHPESSAALAANAFGFFLERSSDLPRLPRTDALGWPAKSLILEGIVPFPWWPGGTHPHLDILIEAPDALIGVESKRYEPFRPHHASGWSQAYWRDCWGNRMEGYKSVRDLTRDEPCRFVHLDAPQLVKHAFGLRTQALKRGVRAVLFYLYAEPKIWPDGRGLPHEVLTAHREEVEEFGRFISGDEVEFLSCSYGVLLRRWREADITDLRQHADALAFRFSIESPS